MNDLTFERELRSTLHALVPYEVPASLSGAVASLPETRRPRPVGDLAGLLRRGAGSRRLAAATMSLLAVAMAAVIGTVVVLGYGLRLPGSSGAGNGPRAYSWQTQVVSFEADSATVEAGGRTFNVPASAQLHSDPGDSTYETLELDWSEQGIQQRLYFYFAANNATWWVTQIRTYDGLNPAEWVYYQATQIKAALGASFVGDVDLSGTGDHGNGRLQLTNVRLMAFLPGGAASYQPGCQMAGPVGDRVNAPAPTPGNQDLSQWGIAAGMPANIADTRLNAAGVCHDFRYMYANYSQRWCSPPPGDIWGWGYGSDGTLILFVDAHPGETMPPDSSSMPGC